jgi:hypothetical protein
MRLNQPKKITWWISIILLVVGVLGEFVTIPVIDGYTFWFTAASAVLLILATALKGL